MISPKSRIGMDRMKNMRIKRMSSILGIEEQKDHTIEIRNIEGSNGKSLVRISDQNKVEMGGKRGVPYGSRRPDLGASSGNITLNPSDLLLLLFRTLASEICKKLADVDDLLMLRIRPLDESEASSQLQALVALKKGTSLVKYSRKGKPKLCPFRLSTDETTLIWLSRKVERYLKLESVSQIIPGQRTAVFRRFFCPEKDYLSFSLIYNNGERSLDLICKDKTEAEIWFTGLQSLISKGRRSPRTSGTDRLSYDAASIQSNPFGATLGITSSISRAFERKSSVDLSLHDSSFYLARSDVGPDRANMLPRTSNGDNFRISVSSAPSSSSQSSGPDDCESLGDVYVWGEVWSDGSTDGQILCSRTDVLLPKPLESNVVLDVQQISCGVRHAALVTRQGEVFTWGEESGGRLGLGTDVDVSKPQLVELLAACNVEYVACGEYHTCAVSVSGDLFSWGDGTHNTGLLGHGTDVSHWMPKRVSGPLEGIQVLSVACGTWHSALVTSNGKVFTFGDGSFGALGHGDRESVPCPKEVEALGGLKTVKVACGVWHTAAIVEIPGQVAPNVISRKLFTWGDGDKYRLGHGDKDAQLVPMCISLLIDYNFHQLACGHTITIGLTTSGHVFTMGSTAYGQLGNLQSDGKFPCLVQDKLANELVEDIACGSYHVAVLTSRSEVYTWGKGANGQLGHGDLEDRKTPTLVEALKDRHVKSISCGSNFTASVCIHKWVSGADQSVCSGCRQAFGFTRKRHNCYNCGMVHCHACSSKKVMRAALAPMPGKPHRVCDSCYTKLKAAETGSSSNFIRKHVAPRFSIDTRERSDRGETRQSKSLFSAMIEPVKYIEIKAAKQGVKSDSASQLKEISFPNSLSALPTGLKPILTSKTPVNSRPASPFSGKSSSPRCATPGYSKSVVESLKKTNEHLNQEVINLQLQVRSLKQKCEIHDAECQKYEKKAKDATLVAEKESSKCAHAVEIVKSITEQMNSISGKLPTEVNENLIVLQSQAEMLFKSHTRINSSSSQIQACEEPTSIGDKRSDNSRVGNDQSLPSTSNTKVDGSSQCTENGCRSPQASKPKSTIDGETQFIEQFEPGVYVTLIRLQDGTKVFKRIRFSKRRFAEQQAEDWWKDNQERVLKKYGHPMPDASSPRS